MKNIKRLFYFRSSLFIYSLFLIIFNLFLIQLPLTGTFGYEFAAVNGLLFVILSGLYTLNFLSKSDFKYSDLMINLAILFLIPLLLVILKSILTMFCSFWDGLIFYFLIVFTSTIFGVAIASLIDLIFTKFKRILFLFVIFLIALIPVFEIYFLPQVYFYSPLIGFFPGNIYDEGLSPDLKLFIHQVIIITFSGLILFSIVRFYRFITNHKTIFVAIILIAAALFQYFSSDFGFSTTTSKLNKILYKNHPNRLFSLHYDDLSFDESRYVTYNIMYFYRELENKLKIKPSNQIHIYLFNSRQQKKELFGAGNADVAKPWQYSIYISADSWEKTLKHELVHVFSAEFGTGIFKLASGFNPALIEGIAEAIEGSTDNYSLIDFTTLAYNNNHKIDLTALFSGLNFFKSNSSLAYTYSGAFIQFLIKKYGIEKVKKFYANGEYYLTFNSSLNGDQKQFEESLKISSFGNQAMADYYFGRLSILQKICPRYVSDRLQTGFDLLNEGKYHEAENLFNEINTKTINYSALIGLSEVYIEQKKINKAIMLLEKNINKFDRTPYYYNLKFRLGDLYSLQNKVDSAKYYYKSLIDEKPHYDFIQLSNVRLSLLQKNLLNDYLNGDDTTKFRIIRSLNDSTYNYNSIPILISLAQSLKINYEEFIREFTKTFIVDNLESSYAAFKLSQYMLANLDFANGRKYAALSLRYKNKNPFYFAMKENYEKANSFYNNIKDVNRTNF